jgi:hypothetical protein
VTVEDLASVVARGFDELELVKRATLAGTGTCQGSGLPHCAAFWRGSRELTQCRRPSPLVR